MSKQLLIYQDVKPVNKKDHQDLSLKGTGTLEFLRDVNSIPLTLPEIPLAAHEFPIVFSGNDDAVVPTLVVGIANDENLAINEDNKWIGRYVPAFVRRYPFVFSKSDEAESFTLCIDETYPGVNRDGKGERLFDSAGENTQYLEGVLTFLKEYQAHFVQTQIFCDRLKELDLLEPVAANFEFADGSKASLSGFQAVSRKKLKEIPEDQLLAMFQRDELELLYMHLFSMNRFNYLNELSQAKKDAGAKKTTKKKTSSKKAETTH